MSEPAQSRNVMDGWIRTWLTLGPFECGVTELPRTLRWEQMQGLLHWGGERPPRGLPRSGAKVPPEGCRWRRVSFPGSLCTPEVPEWGAWPRWLYAAVYLDAAEDISARVEVCCQGCFMMRLGGRPVLWYFGWPLSADAPPKETELLLSKGTGLMLFKLIWYGGEPCFGIRLTDSVGTPLGRVSPLRVLLEPPRGMRAGTRKRPTRRPARRRAPTTCAAPTIAAPLPSDVRDAATRTGCLPARDFRCEDGTCARLGTTVYPVCTDAAVWFVLECETREPPEHTEPLAELSDHVILLLDTAHAHRERVKVLVTRQGQVESEGIPNEDVEACAEPDENGWRALVALPFAALGLDDAPPCGQQWGVNFIRVCPESGDGPTFWSGAPLHWDDETLLPGDGPHRASIQALRAVERAALPERYGHLVFGGAGTRLERATVESSKPGRPRVRVTINNPEGKAKFFVTYRVVGKLYLWPDRHQEPRCLQSGQKTRLLPPRSRATCTIVLEPLPPGDYSIELEVEIPGRDFSQTLQVPFSCPRELTWQRTTKRQKRRRAKQPPTTQSEGIVEFFLPEAPRHEFLLALECAGAAEDAAFSWNGTALTPSAVRTLEGGEWVEIPVPSELVNPGQNRLEVVADDVADGSVPCVRTARLRLEEAGSWDAERGLRSYSISPRGMRPHAARWLPFADSERAAVHRLGEFLPCAGLQSLDLPALLDRSGATLEHAHREFSLEAPIVVSGTALEALTAPTCTVNGSEVALAQSPPRTVIVDGRKAALVAFTAPLSEHTLRNGLSTIVLHLREFAGFDALLGTVTLSETRWDDPEVIHVPSAVTAGSRFEMVVRTDRPHKLQALDLPGYVGQLFELPLRLPPGEHSLGFAAHRTGIARRASLRFEDALSLLITPASLPHTRGNEADAPTYALSDGPLEVCYAAIRGQLRSEGREAFRVALDQLTIPSGSPEQVVRFASLLRRATFLAGGVLEVGEPSEGAEFSSPPPSHWGRRGLPIAEAAVVVAPEDSVPDALIWSPPVAVKALSLAMLRGQGFPGPNGPVCPCGPTGHFAGTPLGKFDVVASEPPQGALESYGLLVLGVEHPPPALLLRLRNHVEKNGASLVCSAQQPEALEAFGISGGALSRARMLRFTGGERRHLAVHDGLTYVRLEPEHTHGVFEPSGDAALGAWRCGEGTVFVTAGQDGTYAALTVFTAACLEHIIGPRARVRCDNPLVNLSVYLDSPKPWAPACSGEQPTPPSVSPPPMRIYLTDTCWWSAQTRPAQCTLDISGTPLPLQWPADRIKMLYLFDEVALTDTQDALFFERAARRQDCCEIYVLGSGAHSIIACSLGRGISAVNVDGQNVDFSTDDERCIRFGANIEGRAILRLSLK